MSGNIAVVTDSASYLPVDVRERFGIRIVPMTVVIDDEPHQEFVTLDTSTFYERLGTGARVTTSQPPPKRLLEAYEHAAADGAAEILSIHIGSALSGTVNSARIAALLSPVPVTVVDTGQASFIEGLCVWEACEVLAAGGSTSEAAEAALRAGQGAGNIFIVKGLGLLRRGGRFAGEGIDERDESAVPVLALVDGAVRPVATATSVDEAIASMTEYLETAIAAGPGRSFRVGVGDGAATPLADALAQRVARLPRVETVVRYDIGPAVGAHTGPGCTGLAFLGRPV
ncbi:MAG: DegV family protein [Dehalococcoidia bacterium]